MLPVMSLVFLELLVALELAPWNAFICSDAFLYLWAYTLDTKYAISE